MPATALTNISIHPRSSVYGHKGIKKNTCAPYKNTGKGKLGWRMKRLAERRLDHSATLKGLPSGQNPAAFRAPGSMKGY